MPMYTSLAPNVEQAVAVTAVPTAPVATASATSSYGYTQAQADALITCVRGLVVSVTAIILALHNVKIVA